MGTNFYDAVTGRHLGKRAAAGLYCWDCRVTLCREGESRIHTTPSQTGWYAACPSCGRAPEEERLVDSAAGCELGFKSTMPQPEYGVIGCASFSWAVEPRSLETVEAIVDEYGNKYTFHEFVVMLEECQIQHLDLIGVGFS